MISKPPSTNDDSQVSLSEKFQDFFDRYRWTYLLGWVFIAGISLVIKFVGPAIFENLTSMVELIAPSASLGQKVVLAAVLLLVIPVGMGMLAKFLLRALRGRQDVQALETMQNKLYTELAPGDSRGFPVALVNYPRAELRSIGVITATFKEAQGDRDLAAIYLPGCPDPTKGQLRIVAVEDPTFTGWSLEDLTDFHVTFGSISPDEC